MIRKTLTLALLLIIPIPGFLKVVIAHDDVARLRAVVSFTVNDFQPAIDRTGPTNWIARNPRNLSEVFASSVSGGLWRSTDAGNNWRPVRSLQPWSVSAVAYLFDWTADGAVLVTTRQDFRINSGAGVWRSNDRGASWTQVARYHRSVVTSPALTELQSGTQPCTSRRVAACCAVRTD